MPTLSKRKVHFPQGLHASLQQHYLAAGALLFSHKACSVTTILGSCVAVTFHSSKDRVSAICHAMLPSPFFGEILSDDDPLRWKYVSHAIPAMCDYFQEQGLKPSSITVKLFGGGTMMGLHGMSRIDASVGSANVEFATRLLADKGYQILASDVGGFFGRKVIFETQSGTVFVKRVGSVATAA
jgi:chemotaxis protein CheD